MTCDWERLFSLKYSRAPKYFFSVWENHVEFPHHIFFSRSEKGKIRERAKLSHEWKFPPPKISLVWMLLYSFPKRAFFTRRFTINRKGFVRVLNPKILLAVKIKKNIFFKIKRDYIILPKGVVVNIKLEKNKFILLVKIN